MKKAWVIIAFLLVVTSVSGQELINDYNEFSSLDMQFELDSKFRILKSSPESSVEFVTANLSFFPKEEAGTKVENFRIVAQPHATIFQGEDRLGYKWTDPTAADYNFGVTGDISVDNKLIKVEDKLPFPTQDPRYPEFTQPTEFIDISPSIRKQAAELVAGEDDMYMATFKIADWVERNIQYDLNTLTAEAVQTSSWVLDNRQGVCDELTNLFISMVRSLGIPARFVSGVAYTNLGHKWGPHGWAEVYFPDKGWVPFDVTYGQYGWVDPSHIKLKTAADSGDPSVRYLWRAYDIKFKSQKINLTTQLLGKGQKLPEQVPFRVRPLVNNVGPGSFVPFEVTAINTKDHYFPNQYVVTKAQELTERNVKRVLFTPGETKKIYWITEMPKDVQTGFTYFTFVEVEDYFHNVARTNISYSSKGEHYSLEEAQKLVAEMEGSQTAGITKNVELDCSAIDYAFSYEDISITCVVHNKGEEFIRDLEVCTLSDCKKTDLAIDAKKEFQYNIGRLESGIRSIEISATNPTTNVKDNVLMNILDNPDLVVTNFEVPPTVDYATPFDISFIMSVSAPVHTVNIALNDEDVTWLPDLQSSKRVVISGRGADYVKRGTANLTISYKDRNDKIYHFKQGSAINVQNVPLFVRILLALRII